MDLDKIQSMWAEDAKIDPDNLHDESLKTIDLLNELMPSLLFVDNFWYFTFLLIGNKLLS